MICSSGEYSSVIFQVAGVHGRRISYYGGHRDPRELDLKEKVDIAKHLAVSRSMRIDIA